MEDAIGNENTGVAFTITLNVSEMMPGTTTPAVRVRYRTSSDGGTAIQAPIYPGEKCSLKSDGTRDPEGASLSDYEFTSGTVVFTAGSSDGDTRTVTIPVCPGRTFPEDGYWFTFEFLEVTGAGFTEEGAMAIGTILPEPGSTAIALTLNPPSVAEGAGDTEVVVTASLDAGARTEDTEVTVSVGDAGDSATSGTDYDAVTNFTVTISSGTKNGTGTFTLTPMDDNVAEGEEMLAVSGTSALPVTSAELTLTDNDPASTAIALALNPPSVAEGAGSTEVTVTATLDAGARPEATEVTVSVGDMGDSADSGTDYDAVDTFTLTISSGQTSGTGTFTLTPMDDNVAEGEETLTVSGSADGLTGDTAALTLADDDPASTAITLTLNPPSVAEDAGGTEVTVTATLDAGARPEATEVTVSVAGNTATEGTDFATVSGGLTVTIMAGQTSGTGTFTLTPMDDNVAEGEETLTVSGTSALPVTSEELTLTDDDPASTAIALTLNPPSVAEDAGGTEVIVTASLDAGARPEATEVTVSVGDMGDSATSGTDYDAVNNFTVTISSGQTSGTGTFTLTPMDDNVAEGEESLTVSGTSALPVTSAELTLTDNDPASTAIALALNPPSVAEGAGSTEVTVTATLDAGARPEATEVTVSVGDMGDSADSGTDYDAVDTFTLTISSGQTSGTGTFTLTPMDDNVAEGEETLTVSGTSALPVTSEELTLIDDDPASTAIALMLNPTRVGEDSGGTEVIVTATLDAGARPEATEVTVSVGDMGDSATSGTDYDAVNNFTVTISSGQTSGTGTFTLTPMDDNVAEGEETLTVSGSATGLTGDTAALTLTDDDTASTAIALTLNPPSVAEDAGGTEVTVTATLDAGARTEATEVTVSVAGNTATEGTDFATVSGGLTVTIMAGQTSGTGTFTLTPMDDNVAEGEETLTVSGTSALPVTSAELTLADDDPASTAIALMLNPPSVAEDAGGTEVIVTASLDAGARTEATEVTVSVGDMGDSATSGTDYDVVNNFTVTISSGQTNGTGRFTLTPTDDNVAEGEETLTVSGSADGLTGDTAALTLTDDDPASTAIALMLNPTSVAEGAGDTEVIVTAWLDAGVRTGATEVTVSVGDASDSATSGTDYDAVNNFTVTISSGQTNGTGTFTLTPTDDNVAEGEETLTVSGTSALPVTSAELTLADDDTASTAIALTLNPPSVAEDAGGTEVTVTATLDAGARTEATEVTVSVGDMGDSATSGTDYDAVNNFTVTISSGQTSGTGTFTLTPTDDNVAEGEETLTVSGSADGLTGDTAALTLTDDDTASTAIALMLNPTSVAEGAGDTEVIVTAWLDAGVRTGATEVTVSVGDASDSATSGTDYDAVNNFTVTISSGQTNGTGTFTLTPTDDNVAEGEETLTVSGTSVLPVTSAELTLADDDTASTAIALTLNPPSVAEDAGGTEVIVTASLDAGARTEATEVTVSVGDMGDSADSGTDYDAVDTFTLTISSGQTSGTGTFTLTPMDDNVAEGEETLTVSGSADGLTGDTAALTLADDDPASTAITLTLNPPSVAEDAGGTEVTVTATLDAGARPEATEVTVSVAGNTATEGTDFATVSGGLTVTIMAGQTSGTGTFTLTPMDDNVAEGEETLTVSGTSALPVTSEELTLADDDPASTAIALMLNPPRVAEDAGGTEVIVTASLDAGARPEATEVTVSVGDMGDSATSGTDYDAVNNFTVTISSGQTSGTGTFTLTPTDDNVAEGEETLTVSGSADGLTGDTAALTLTDDDTASTAIALMLNPTSVAEGAGDTEVIVTAWLDAGVRTGATEVTVSVGDASDSATSGTDYDAVNNFTVTISSGQTNGTGTFTLTPTDDNVAEGEETLTVSGTSALPVTSAELTLADDDTASTAIALALNPPSVAEDAGGTEVIVTASLDAGARPEATEVTVSVAGNTATEGTDFATVSGGLTVTIMAGQTSGTGTFTLTPMDDNVAEGEETLTVSGTSALPVTSAELTLADDDTASTAIALTLNPPSVAEDAGGTEVTVTATLDAGARTEATEVTVSVGDMGDSATSGTDYDAVNNFTVTISSGQTSGTGTFTLTPMDDNVAEGEETLTVSGTSALPVTSEELTLTGDDTASTAIALTLDPDSVGENATSTVIVTAALNAKARPEATEVMVSVGDPGDSAASGTDYKMVDDFTVTIPATRTSGSGTFTLAPIHDEIVEADKTLTVSGRASGLTGDTTTLTIIDDDTGGVSVLPTSVTVTEGDASARYTVTLEREPASDVTVTVHGANDDVTVSPRSLTFTTLNWNRNQTVTVEAVSDSVAEREERVTLTHMVSGGGYDGVTAASVSVKVVSNYVGAAAAWLVRFGRTVAGQAVDALTGRLDGGGESYVTLGGHRLVGSSGAALERGAGDARTRGPGNEQPLTERELLLGSAFHLRSGPGEPGEPGGAAFATWGRIASGRFEANVGGRPLDGDVRTSFVGADLSAGRWLAGAAAAFSKGEGGYGLAGDSGGRTVVSRLTSLFPYAQVHLGERISAWGLVGRGTGKLTLIEKSGTGADRYATDIEMQMGAAGVRGTLATAPEGIGLALRSDVFWMRTSSDPIEEMGVASSELKAHRLRLVLDASRPFALGEGTTLTPSLEVGVRHDGGDAETGRGVEVGAGLRYAGVGFRIEGTVRGLALHDESAYEEWGASGSVRIEPEGAGRGLSLTLAPAWGNPSSADRRLWSARDAAGLAPDRDIEAGWRLDAEVGYGLRSPSGPGVVTPYAAFSVGEGAGRILRTGTRWRLAPGATLGLEASRAGSPSGDEGPVNALTLRAAVRW